MLKKLSEETVAERLTMLTAWRREGDDIIRDWTFVDFNQAFGFLARVALLAEQADHHPEIYNVWNRVILKLTTHDANGLTHKDFDLASRIDALV